MSPTKLSNLGSEWEMKGAGFQGRVCRGINVCVVSQFVHVNSKIPFTFTGCRNTSKKWQEKAVLAWSAINETPLALSLEAVHSAVLGANGKTEGRDRPMNNPTEAVSVAGQPELQCTVLLNTSQNLL